MAEHSGPVRGSGDVAMEMRAEMQGGRLPRVGGTDRRSQEGGQAGGHQRLSSRGPGPPQLGERGKRKGRVRRPCLSGVGLTGGGGVGPCCFPALSWGFQAEDGRA